MKPDQNVDLFHVNELHSQLDVVPIGLNIHNEHKCIVAFCFSMADSVVGDFDDSIVVKFVFSRGCSSEDMWATFRAPMSWKWVTCGSFFVCGCGLLSALLSLPAEPLLWLWRGSGFFLCFRGHLHEKPFIAIFSASFKSIPWVLYTLHIGSIYNLRCFLLIEEEKICCLRSVFILLKW